MLKENAEESVYDDFTTYFIVFSNNPDMDIKTVRIKIDKIKKVFFLFSSFDHLFIYFALSIYYHFSLIVQLFSYFASSYFYNRQSY